MIEERMNTRQTPLDAAPMPVLQIYGGVVDRLRRPKTVCRCFVLHTHLAAEKPAPHFTPLNWPIHHQIWLPVSEPETAQKKGEEFACFSRQSLGEVTPRTRCNPGHEVMHD